MSEPIEKVAERVLAMEPERYQGQPTFATYRRMEEADVLDEMADAAPALAREVLALRKLCRALAEDLSALVPGHLESDVAALAAYRQHFPEPKPDVTKEPR